MSGDRTSAEALQRVRVTARGWSVDTYRSAGEVRVTATPDLGSAVELAYGSAVELPTDDPAIVALAQEQSRASRVCHRAMLLLLARPDSPLHLPETFMRAAEAVAHANPKLAGDDQVKEARGAMADAARSVSHAWTVGLGSSHVGAGAFDTGDSPYVEVVCDVSDSAETQDALTDMVTEALTEAGRQEQAWDHLKAGRDVPPFPDGPDDDRPEWVRQVTA